MIRRPPRSTLFPSTTLSRSIEARAPGHAGRYAPARAEGPAEPGAVRRPGGRDGPVPRDPRPGREDGGGVVRRRSEEHTSQLQSRQYLVCRLLLEKITTFG